MNEDRYQKGMEIMRKQLGPDADNYVAKLTTISKEFAQINVEFPFGDIYSRPLLGPKIREMITLAALTVQGYAIAELKIHIKAALHLGITRDEILEIIIQMLAYCGFPAATNALLAAQEVFDDINAGS